jgi:hypothetical protein
MPELEARRCTRTGSSDGLGGGPAGRFPRSRVTCAHHVQRLATEDARITR